MTTKQTLTTTALLTALCGAAHAQAPANVAFQYFANDDKLPATMSLRVNTIEAIGGKTTPGRPFSATEERHTLQVLGDGTRIDKKESDKYFRDTDGRTRIERDNGDTIMISDPVSGVTTEMSNANKTARKIMVRRSGTFSTSSSSGSADVLIAEKMRAETHAMQDMPRPTAATIAGSAGAARPGITFSTTEARSFTFATGAADVTVPLEDLGTQIINGVPAKGTRSTVTIAAGQIGNDREIKIVSERWYSEDLGMLIKSSNKDPRFGETTYELTNILTGAQDPTLFQIPADFKMNGGVR
jgi:hypothetical protein